MLYHTRQMSSDEGVQYRHMTHYCENALLGLRLTQHSRAIWHVWHFVTITNHHASWFSLVINFRSWSIDSLQSWKSSMCQELNYMCTDNVFLSVNQLWWCHDNKVNLCDYGFPQELQFDNMKIEWGKVRINVKLF